MELSVIPADGPVDTTPTLRVDGVAPGTMATLTVRTTDAAGHRWRFSGTYPVGPDGALRIDDPERPWWDMRFEDPDTPPVAFVAADDALEYRVSVSCGTRSAEEVVRRTWGGDAERTEVAGDGWRLRLYHRSGTSATRPGVLLVPGSTGVSAMAPAAALLAAHGYATGVLGYMQDPGLPASFRRIPVEAITAGMRAFTQARFVSGDLVVLAASVGSVAALAALSGEDAVPVRGIIVLSPSSVVWQAMGEGGPPPKASMLTRNDDDLPYLPIRGEKLIGQMLRTAVARRLTRRPRSSALRLLPAYAAALAKVGADTGALLPVERISAPLLAVAGSDDAMWPAATMAQALVERRRAHGTGDADRLLLLPGAGHFLRPPVIPTTVDRNDALISGGTPEGNARGQRAAWTATLEFLQQTLPACS